MEIIHKREIINELTKIKGIGKWTAEMFLYLIFVSQIYLLLMISD